MTVNGAASPYERILTAVLDLLREGGAPSVSTRAITSRAGVQAPAIYRLFGDKDGLLDAAAERAFADWVAGKSSTTLPDDPVEALRAGWDDTVRFGLDQPAAYRIADARPHDGPSVVSGRALLREKVSRVAAAGRLAVSVERAVALMHATARGVILSLIDVSPDERDLGLSDLARESTIAAITTDAPATGDGSLAAAATTLRALAPLSRALEPAERQLLDVWLARIADAEGPAQR
jgi:AcrR family transcriptional regulator